jgi:hypothetical protein
VSGVDVAIVIPVFNDWEPLVRLLDEINETLSAAKLKGRVVVVDDGSNIVEDGRLRGRIYASLSTIEMVHLISNQGHQRAIAIGLVHVSKSGMQVESVVVMDGDGEDRPDHIPQLLRVLRSGDSSVVFAARTERHEGILFRVMYQVYCFLYRLMLGVPVRWGNYSAMRVSALSLLTMSPDLWNHYAAAVVRSRLRFGAIGLPRGQRYTGRTHMTYTSLVIHGLSSIAASSEMLGARMLMVLSVLLAVSSAGLAGELAARAWLPIPIPNIAIAVTVLLAGLTVQGIAFTFLFTLIVLGRRSQAGFVPLRDAPGYIDRVEQIETVEAWAQPDQGAILSQISSS